MNIINRFSTYLKDALTRSVMFATEMRNTEVTPLHLFFSLSVLKGSIAAEIISSIKIDPKIIEQLLVSIPSVRKSKTQTEQAELAVMSDNSKNILEKAIMIAHKNNHNYVGTEHLLFSIINCEDKNILKLFEINNVQKDKLIEHIKAVFNNASQFTQIAEISEVVEKMQNSLNNNPMNSPNPMDNLSRMNNINTANKNSVLDLFATNITSKEMQLNIDPVIGRENEVERMIQILCRRNKNNPVLIGEPGVGKTAIVEGLAKKILTGNVPDILLDKKIYALDMSMVLAGTTFRGEFEARMQQVIEEIASDPNIIVFIDELHNIVGAGSNQGTMDAANILKPALARGQIHCIGATTPTEFKKYIEHDGALERRFQPIIVKQSSVEDTIKILDGIKSNYEKYHNVKITKKAVEQAARLADRYVTDKFLPDKAIDLLDETAASVRVKQKNSSTKNSLISLQRELEHILKQKEVWALNDKFDKALELKNKAEKVEQKIAALKKNIKPSKRKKVEINETHILKQLAKILNTDVDELLIKEKSKMNNLNKKIKTEIVGQDNVIDEVSDIVRQAQLQLSNPDRPLASFMFVGNSGVGKTELAKVLAKTLYPNMDSLIKLNMSEFNEAFGVSKLLGSPAGYVGYKESNQFTDKLKMNPYSVVLFDEIDKAHKDVSKLLLQILENGEITDSMGRKISLKHGIIILTTTVGAKEAIKKNIGFTKNNDSKETKQILDEKLKDFFSAEIINRIDRVCLFNDLDSSALEQIAKLEVKNLNKQLNRYKTRIKTPLSTIKNILQSSNKKNARAIRTHIRKELEQVMAEKILNNEKLKTEYSAVISKNKLVVK